MIIDLSDYQLVSPPYNFGDDSVTYIALHPANLKPCYTLYTNKHQGCAEVVYSRLCQCLMLPCVEAQFVTHKCLKDGGLMSASSFDMSWKSYQKYDIKNDSTILNPHEIQRHYVLQIIMGSLLWGVYNAGYVLSDNRFVKSNNGHVFGTLIDGVPTSLEINPSWLYEQLSEYPEAKLITESLTLLGEENIQYCTAMPNELRNEHYYFSQYLRNVCNMSERYLDLLEDVDD